MLAEPKRSKPPAYSFQIKRESLLYPVMSSILLTVVLSPMQRES
jgi:hypothetical protein